MKRVAAIVLIAVVCLPATIIPQSSDLSTYNDPPSRLRGVIEKFQEDYGFLSRFYSAPTSPHRSERMRRLYGDNLLILAGLDFNKLNHDEQVDFLLFKNYLEHETKEQL